MLFSVHLQRTSPSTSTHEILFHFVPRPYLKDSHDPPRRDDPVVYSGPSPSSPTTSETPPSFVPSLLFRSKHTSPPLSSLPTPLKTHSAPETELSTLRCFPKLGRHCVRHFLGAPRCPPRVHLLTEPPVRRPQDRSRGGTETLAPVLRRGTRSKRRSHLTRVPRDF